MDAFNLHYDYSQHTPEGESKHFDILDDPAGTGGKALRIAIYHDDLSMALQDDYETPPRSEIGGSRAALPNDVKFEAKWEYYFDKLESDYQFCLM